MTKERKKAKKSLRLIIEVVPAESGDSVAISDIGEAFKKISPLLNTGATQGELSLFTALCSMGEADGSNSRKVTWRVESF